MSELRCAHCHAIIPDDECCVEIVPQHYKGDVPPGFVHFHCIMPYLIGVVDSAWRRREQIHTATPKEN